MDKCKMVNAKTLRRSVLAVVIFVLLLIFVGLTRYFTEQDGTESNMESRGLAAHVQSLVAEQFPVNPNDLFWRETINLLIRKAAHFAEYMLVGMALCLLLNIVLKRIWLSLVGATLICVVLAYLDEFRQKFIEGRHPQWFDVRVDSYGAITGIIVTTVAFLIYKKIKSLKDRIHELESQLGTEGSRR